jgi:DNA-binding transcriptional regulator YiaG
LSWKTAKANYDDMIAHGTRRYGSQVTGAKLTEDDVRKIRDRTEFSSRQMSRAMGVSPSHIRKIRSGEVWTWLK